mgnify:CR=1 FL=1|jgi:antirestriction protein
METIKFSFGELKLTSEVINRLEELGYTPESLKDALKEHGWDNPSDSPALYCGTYGKYNNFNVRGMWVNLSTFGNYEDFERFCLAIHADEANPELMYQDHANIPDSLYQESMGKKGFDKIMEYREMCEDYNVFAVNDFLERWSPEDLDRMPDAYVGVYDSEEDFAEETVNDCYDIDKIMGNLATYFDYKAFARDLFMSDYYFGSHGTVLRTF